MLQLVPAERPGLYSRARRAGVDPRPRFRVHRPPAVLERRAVRRRRERRASVQRRHLTIGREHTDSRVPRVGHEQSAILPNTDVRRAAELRLQRRAVHAPALLETQLIPRRLRPGHGGDHAVLQAANAVVTGVGDEEGPVRAECQPRRVEELRLLGRSIDIPARQALSRSRAGDGGHLAAAVDAADAVVAAVGDVDRSIRADCDSRRPIELRVPAAPVQGAWLPPPGDRPDPDALEPNRWQRRRSRPSSAGHLRIPGLLPAQQTLGVDEQHRAEGDDDDDSGDNGVELLLHVAVPASGRGPRPPRTCPVSSRARASARCPRGRGLRR